jgi:SulP family sulfate permease
VIPPPKAFILRFKHVPLVDASGVTTLERFLKRCAGHGAAVILCELQPRSRAVLAATGVLAHVIEAETYEAALARAREAIVR